MNEEIIIPEKLLNSVKKDCEEGNKCFNCNGCNHEFYRKEKREGDTTEHCYRVSKCFHKYCDKLKWIVDRAKHYSEKTGVSASEILKGWEEQRDYWYMNFYQESNQPEIKSNNVIVVKNREEFFEKYPSKKFICPYCKGISTNPNECNSGKEVELMNGKKKTKEVCNWKSYGLFATLNGGVHVFLKDDLRLLEIFKPMEMKDV